MEKFSLIILICSVILISGCADVDIPTPKEILKHPIGTESVKIGMSKDRVKDLWGDPTQITYEKIEGEFEMPRDREVWVYKAEYGMIPVDAGYLSKTKYLYFDGNNLTKISEVDLSLKEETK